MKYVSYYNSQCPGLNSNREPPESKSQTLLLEPVCSVPSFLKRTESVNMHVYQIYSFSIYCANPHLLFKYNVYHVNIKIML
jgi:hypothetical protein